MLWLDFETLNPTVDLTKVGSYVYASHPETRITAALYAVDDGPVEAWRGVYGSPGYRLGDAERLPAVFLEPPTPIVSWGSFDRLIWNAQLTKLGAPELPVEAWVCGMTLARHYNLAAKLELAAKAVPGVRRKQMELQRRIRYMFTGPLPDSAQGRRDMEVLVRYGLGDVETMRQICQRLPALPDHIWPEYWASERINDRGLLVDLDMCEAAVAASEKVREEIGDELSEITSGECTSHTQYQRIALWVYTRLPDNLRDYCVKERGDDGNPVRLTCARSVRSDLLGELQGDFYDAALAAALECSDEANKASVYKYRAALNRADDGGCLRGSYALAGAAATGRFASYGLQTHNLIRTVPAEAGEWIEAIKDNYFDGKRWPDTGKSVNQTLSVCLRPTIVAERGRLTWLDYKSIEAMVLPWLCRAEHVLDLFRSGVDKYVHAAQQLFVGEEIDADKRQIGKVSDLALGFGGALGAFQSMARAYGIKIPDEMALDIVRRWRAANPWAPAFWDDLMNAARAAYRFPGQTYPGGRVEYLYVPELLGGTLCCRLPCGRWLHYPHCKWEEYEAHDGSIRRGLVALKWGKVRRPLWHGLLAENVTQAVAGSLLRHSLRLLVDRGYDVRGHTHDEVIIDGGAEGAAAIMERPPAWGEGLPLAVEAKSGRRYYLSDA